MKRVIFQVPGRLTALILSIWILAPAAVSGQEKPDSPAEDRNLEIHTLQAVSVGHKLELEGNVQDKLTAAYLMFRQEVSNQRKEKLTGMEGENREQESRRIVTVCLDQFNAEMKTFLNQEQAESAFFLLGSLNKRWDQYLRLLLDFGLEPGAMNQASNAVFSYVDEYLLERKKADDAGTRLSGTVATGLKEKLDGKISEILSPDQYATWQESTAFKRKNK